MGIFLEPTEEEMLEVLIGRGCKPRTVLMVEVPIYTHSSYPPAIKLLHIDEAYRELNRQQIVMIPRK